MSGNTGSVKLQSVSARTGSGGEDIEFLEKSQNYPLPPNCNYCRFILPVALFKALREHPLSREIFPVSAGYFQKEKHRQECKRLPYCLIYYCIGGNMVLDVEGHRLPVVTGDLIAIPSGIPYAIEMASNAPYSFYYVAYAGERMADYVEYLNVPRFVTHVGLIPDMVTELEKICNLRDSDFLLDTFVNGANRLKFLLTGISLAISRGPQGARHRLDIDLIRQMMAKRINGSLTLQEMALSVNYSPRHFVRIFKKLTGIPPMRYYMQTRIQYACHQLDTTLAPIGQIAAAVGFEDPHYFSRIFRKEVGQTPYSYRHELLRGR